MTSNVNDIQFKDNLGNFNSISDILGDTFLQKKDAANTYLTTTDAANTYVPLNVARTSYSSQITTSGVSVAAGANTSIELDFSSSIDSSWRMIGASFVRTKNENLVIRGWEPSYEAGKINVLVKNVGTSTITSAQVTGRALTRPAAG